MSLILDMKHPLLLFAASRVAADQLFVSVDNFGFLRVILNEEDCIFFDGGHRDLSAR